MPNHIDERSERHTSTWKEKKYNLIRSKWPATCHNVTLPLLLPGAGRRRCGPQSWLLAPGCTSVFREDPSLPTAQSPSCPLEAAPKSGRSIAYRPVTAMHISSNNNNLISREGTRGRRIAADIAIELPCFWAGYCAYWKCDGRGKFWWTWRRKPTRIRPIGSTLDPVHNIILIDILFWQRRRRKIFFQSSITMQTKGKPESWTSVAWSTPISMTAP